jgi:hypothetical protein
VPGTQPEPGDVYGADPSVLIGGDAHRASRRVAVLVPVIGMPWWRTMGRSTTEHQAGDLPSPADPRCNLTQDGWWSERFLHTVESRHFGNRVLCPYYGALCDEARIALLAFWESL